MRLLTAIAGVVAIAAASCFTPGLEDCQFLCGAGTTCPVGTACVDGVCRSDGAAGACPGTGGDDGDSPDGGAADPDGNATTVDGAGACPAAPCEGTVADLGDRCAVLCPTQSFSSASATCAAGGWRLAIADTPARRAAFKAAFDQVVAWVGLTKTNDGVSGWQWLGPPISDQPTDAAAHPPWASGEPMANRLYATLDTGPALAALATSPGPELAFCEVER